MKLKTTQYIPRDTCTDALLKRLRKAGFKTHGYAHHLEKILIEKEFGLPSEDEDCWGFTVEHKYIRIYLNYSDALANEILLLNELKMI